MAKTPLNQLLANQFIILSFFKRKLDVVNFIRWGYDNDLPILINNRFLHSVAHTYYRSAIVEICTLFDDNRHQSNNFYLLTKLNKKFIKELESTTVDSINQKLDSSKTFFMQEILDIRNEEVSHFRFKNGTVISLNNNFLPELTQLNKLAEEIIDIASQGQIDKSNVAGYINQPRNPDLFSLQNLLKDINGIDYSKIWKNQ